MRQETFGERVRHLRLGRKLNMAQLAEKIGSTPCLIMDIEAGRLDDLVERLRKMAMVLGMSPEQLIGFPDGVEPVYLTWDGVRVEQRAESLLSGKEIDAYIRRGKRLFGRLAALQLTVPKGYENEIEIQYQLEKPRCERIRRITDDSVDCMDSIDGRDND